MRKILLLLPFFLWTCGGGGGSTEPEPPQLPTVQNINLEGVEDTPITFTPLGTDPQGLSLTYSISTQPENGNVVINNTVGTYTPNANYNGSDTFYYLASNSGGNSNIGTVAINIAAVDDEPNTMDVNVITDEDNSVSFNLQAEEYDGDNIEFNVTENPSNGTLTITGANATYTPEQDWNGTVTFNFEAVDSSSRSIINVATGTITVNPINDAPIVENIDDQYMYIGKSTNIEMTGTDIEGDNLTYSIVSSPSNSSVSINNNLINFEPSNIGTFTITFKANDGIDDSNIGQVNVEVQNTGYGLVFGGDEEEESFSIIETSNGEYVIGGNSNQNAHLLKISSSGSKIWERTFESSRLENAFEIDETVDGGFVIAGYSKESSCCNHDIYLAKTDSNGNLEWSSVKDYGDGRNFARSVQETVNGNFILTGFLWSNREDIHVLKTDSNGNEIWSKNIDLDSGQQGYKIIETFDGGYAITGSNGRIIKLDSNGNEEWQGGFAGNGQSIKQTSDGGYILGISYGNGNDGNDIALLKMNQDGQEEWFKVLSSNGNEFAYDVVQANDNGYIIVGQTDKNGSEDMYIIKTDSNGNEEWSNTYGSSFNEIANSISSTSDNYYVIAGFSQSFSSNNNKDIYVIKIDDQGNQIF